MGTFPRQDDLILNALVLLGEGMAKERNFHLTFPSQHFTQQSVNVG